jgi:RHS repeat-associated core domain
MEHGLNLYDFHARTYDLGTGRFLSVDPMAEKYYSISPYAYCANNPLIYVDPTGEYIESVWDIASLIMGAKSFVDNVKAGKVGAAVVDGLGVVVDAAAVVVPFVPGGVGATIKGVRTVDKAVSAAKVADKGADAIKVNNTTKAIGPIGDAGATVTKQLPDKMQSNSRTTNNGQGTLFKDSGNPTGNHVRVQSGNPNSSFPAQQKPYVKETRNGKSIDINGKPTSSDFPEAHIPKYEYKYDR